MTFIAGLTFGFILGCLWIVWLNANDDRKP
jgi:hypothetical protein